VLERISGLKREEVTAGWRKQQENLHRPPNTINVQILEDTMQGTWSYHERDKCKILIGKAEGKTYGRWKYNTELAPYSNYVN
jgi:hypothetical protein